MFLPYNVDVPMARLPIANWLLIGVTCLISVALFLVAPDGQVSPLGLRLDSTALLGLFTHLFVHADPFHLC